MPFKVFNLLDTTARGETFEKISQVILAAAARWGRAVQAAELVLTHWFERRLCFNSFKKLKI